MIEVQRLTMTAAVVREMHRVDFERILRGTSRALLGAWKVFDPYI